MDFRFDAGANTAYIRLRKGKVVRSQDMGNGYVFDYNRLNKVLGIEVLEVSQKVKEANKDALSALEREVSIADIPVPDHIWKLTY